jgi:hypothetical protein
MFTFGDAGLAGILPVRRDTGRLLGSACRQGNRDEAKNKRELDEPSAMLDGHGDLGCGERGETVT